MALQPTLPAEGLYTDAEFAFIELSPPGLWPDNQDSNFGQFRRVVTDVLQSCIDEVDHLNQEAFIATAVEYLSLWEELVGLPVAPAGKTDLQRRTLLAPQLQYGPFTRTRRRLIVEKYIEATFGQAVSLTPAGVSLTAAGVPLYSGAFSLTGTYNIVENITGFSYEVRILNTITIDTAGLTNELTRITPAGISFTINFVAVP